MSDHLAVTATSEATPRASLEWRQCTQYNSHHGTDVVAEEIYVDFDALFLCGS